jgi:hypothetical protein
VVNFASISDAHPFKSSAIAMTMTKRPFICLSLKRAKAVLEQDGLSEALFQFLQPRELTSRVSPHIGLSDSPVGNSPGPRAGS